MKKVTLVTSATLLALALTGCNNASNDAEPVAEEQAAPTATEQAPIEQAAVQTPEQAGMAQPEFISINDAIAAALKNTSGDASSVDFDTHDNGTRADYEIDIIANDLKHEVKVDAATANIINVTQKNLDADDQAEHQALQQAKVSLEQALKVATDSMPGSVATEISFDVEQGVSMYEVKLVADNQKHEVKVDANTGSILSSKLD